METIQTPQYDYPANEAHYQAAGMHPQAMELLQGVFGPNDMLEDLTQQQAQLLAGDMLETYFAAYDADAEQYGDYMLNSDDRKRLHGIVTAYMDGETEDTIAAHNPAYGTAEEVAISLGDVAASLRRWDELPRTDAPDVPGPQSLQEVREQYDYPVQAPALFGTFEGGMISKPRGEWLRANTESARLRYEAYVASPAFQDLARRQGRHNKDSEVFEIGHETQTEEATILSRAATYYLAYKFASKDGDRLAGLGFYDNPDLNTLYLLVNHAEDGTVSVGGALFDREQDSDGMLPAFQSIPESFGKPIEATFEADMVPNLLDSRDTTEIVAVATDTPSDALKLYNAACLRAVKQETHHFVANLDREAGNSLVKYPGGFRILESLGEVAFHTRVPGSNMSGLYYCNLPNWQKALKQKRPAVYSFFWETDNRLRRDCELTVVTPYTAEGDEPEAYHPEPVAVQLRDSELRGSSYIALHARAEPGERLRADGQPMFRLPKPAPTE